MGAPVQKTHPSKPTDKGETIWGDYQWSKANLCACNYCKQRRAGVHTNFCYFRLWELILIKLNWKSANRPHRNFHHLLMSVVEELKFTGISGTRKELCDHCTGTRQAFHDDCTALILLLNSLNSPWNSPPVEQFTLVPVNTGIFLSIYQWECSFYSS